MFYRVHTLAILSLQASIAHAGLIDLVAAATRIITAPPSLKNIRIEENFIYLSRREAPESDRTMALLATGLPAALGRDHPLILLLDFNPGPGVIPKANIITAETSGSIGSRSFFSLTEAEKSALIYEPYFQRITATGFDGLVHIDHHYPHPVLGNVSTTVLVGEFLSWIHTRHPGHPILHKLSEAVRLVDHSDPDILLAHFLMNHAADRNLILNHARFLADTALLNDHLRAPKGSEADQKRVRDFFKVTLNLEDEVRDRTLSFAGALKEVLSSIEIPDPARVLRQTRKTESVSQRLRTLPASAMQRNGEILTIRIPDSVPASELSEVLLFLISENPGILNEVRIVVASLPNPANGKRYLKVRSLDGTDLNPLYPLLKAKGLDAGGRASAGAAAYGKSGLEMGGANQERFERDLVAFLSICNGFLSSSCDALSKR